MVPSYAGGGRPRSRTVARRMRPILELVSRGPNGSRGRGATYKVIRPDTASETVTRTDTDDVVIGSDRDWLLEQVERMTNGKASGK